MADFKAVGKQFTEFYYQTFDSSRAGLKDLYRPNSMLTWESKEIVGAESIVEHLQNLPFQSVVHKITTIDAQPSSEDGRNILVSITGQLVVDEDIEHPLPFSQVFQLVQQAGSYFVFNDMFRLNYG
ncbi:nuclear transport factor 2 [Coniophora puteana RWD-64-598 SS2]|uniref:Nuclear transport factor 2 n=1 Tax=Coniophora puteana (strain RWD-64-598) TaxID=741705 RepID=A0A5M3N372_CONPW|nr:nuclear transport factor 2 [Coniophora puteana RWD-64-598 SS2]EIW85474.1 nuclear transport factor 2 [Coniophora puteana RWD-64-598 SS2]